METIACKFGGSSLADAGQIKKVIEIIKKDPRRRYVVVSAPGRRSEADRKITDLLILCHNMAVQEQAFDEVFGHVVERFEQIVAGLGIEYGVKSEFEIIHRNIVTEAKKGDSARRDYAASRGEYLMGKILAKALGWPFVDADLVIRFKKKHLAEAVFAEEETQQLLSSELARFKTAVVPGFYGAFDNGEIKTFPRNFSDYSGAVVARAAKADLYENYTDTSGFRAAPPAIVPEAKLVPVLTHSELRELAYRGASVLHEDSVLPLIESGTHIHLLNTNAPDDPGTMIVPDGAAPAAEVLTGIAGKKGFCSIELRKYGMNTEHRFLGKLAIVLADHDVNIEHAPGGLDHLSIIVRSEELDDCKEEVLKELKERCHPDEMRVIEKLALISMVGRGMAGKPGVIERAAAALRSEKINIRLLNQGLAELHVIIGVDEIRLEDAIRALYRAFF